MSVKDYQAHLLNRGAAAEEVSKKIDRIRAFAEFMARPGLEEEPRQSAKEKVESFSRKLIASGENTLEAFQSLRDYTEWTGDRALYVALMEIMDCDNALEVLAGVIEDRHGRETRDSVFSEKLPPLGSDEKQRCASTRKIAERMARLLSPRETRDAWFQVQHGISPDDWRPSDEANAEKLRRCGGIDAYLDLKRRERDDLLTRLKDQGKLWYTVEIDNDVLEYVKNDPEMEVGRRIGNEIYVSKIPYNAVRYLRETDRKMRRYYACHCPLVREAILDGLAVSPDVCSCSLGHARHYLAGLGRKLSGEVLESAIKGDSRCRFVFHLPSDLPY
jgi:hypothetical protein